MGEQFNNSQSSVMRKSKYDYGYVYFDINDPQNIWVSLSYSAPRRNGRRDIKEVVKRFKTKEELDKFINENFVCEVVNGITRIRDAQMFAHYVDYRRADYYKSTSNPTSNIIEVTVDEYDEFRRRKLNYDGKPKSSIIQFDPKEEEFACSLFGYYGKISQHIKDHPDIFGMYLDNKDVRTINVMRDPYKPTRVEQRYFREKNAFPMPEKRKVNLKWKAALATLSAVVIGASYSLISSAFSNKPVVFRQKNATILNLRDNFIRSNQDRVSGIIDKLMDKRYDELNDDDISLFIEFTKELARGDFDRNNSSTDILYYDYFSDKYLKIDDGSKKTLCYTDVSDLLKKIEGYYSKCRVYTSDGALFRTEETKKYLDFVGSLSIMRDKYPGAWNDSVPKSDDGRGNYASTKEVSIFSQLAPVLEYLILTQYQETLTNSNYTLAAKDRPAYYFGATGEESKNNLLKVVKERRAFLIENIKSAYLAAKRENARQLAIASDAVVAQARAEEEQKSHGGK